MSWRFGILVTLAAAMTPPPTNREWDGTDEEAVFKRRRQSLKKFLFRWSFHFSSPFPDPSPQKMASFPRSGGGSAAGRFIYGLLCIISPHPGSGPKSGDGGTLFVSKNAAKNGRNFMALDSRRRKEGGRGRPADDSVLCRSERASGDEGNRGIFGTRDAFRDLHASSTT